MKSKFPVYIGVDIPGPLCGEVKSIRLKLEIVVSKLPNIVALTGSPGKGPIPSGTELTPIPERLSEISLQTQQWSLQFKYVSRLSNTDIFILFIVDRKPFNDFHGKLSETEFSFSPICTSCRPKFKKISHREYLS